MRKRAPIHVHLYNDQKEGYHVSLTQEIGQKFLSNGIAILWNYGCFNSVLTNHCNSRVKLYLGGILILRRQDFGLFWPPLPPFVDILFSKIGIFFTPTPLGCLRRIRTAPKVHIKFTKINQTKLFCRKRC